MNERFQALIDQANVGLDGYAPGTQPMVDPSYAVFMQRFAELIVKECAEAALAKGQASPDTDFRTGSFVISEFLLARYGVEE